MQYDIPISGRLFKLKKINLNPATRQVLSILGAHFSLWLVISYFFDVHADMADHFMTSRFFSLSYLEHPPMVAWSMAWINLFPANYSITLLKIGAILFNFLILWQTFRVAKLVMPAVQSLWAIGFLATTLYFSAGTIFWNVDQPYLLFWLLATESTIRYTKSKENKYLLLTGLWLGFGALSKYITILFYLALVIWGIIQHKRYKLLFNYNFYLAGVISLLVFSPVIYWNYQFNFASFLFQLNRGLSGGDGLLSLLLFIFGHTLLFSPFFAGYGWVMYIKGAFLKRLNTSEQFLGISAVVVLLFFSLSSSQGAIADPKWLNAGYLGLYILLAKLLNEHDLALFSKRLLITVLVVFYLVNILIVGFIYFQGMYQKITIPTKVQHKIEELFFWTQTAGGIAKILKMQDIKNPPPFVITREYQLGGWLYLYLEHHPFSHSIEKDKRNLWSPPQEVEKNGALIVCPPVECEGLLSKINHKFKNKTKALGQVNTIFPSSNSRILDLHYLVPLSN